MIMHSELRLILPGTFRNCKNLKELYLTGNELGDLASDVFAEDNVLQVLDLRLNRLRVLTPDYFKRLGHLQKLRLSRNRIYYTEDHAFLTLHSLLSLDLHQNEIVWMEEAAFSPLQHLVSLNVEQNNFRGVDKGTFDVMPRLRHIYFDTFYMCAYATHVSDCQPAGDGISSRYNLLENSLLRSAVWVVAILACLGNVLVFMGRSIVKDDNAVHSFLIKNLSLADLLMAIYLLVLATHDLRYRGSYLGRDQEWRNSWGCDVIGVIATLSNEASVMTLTMITLDRYICILYPLKMRRRTVAHAYAVMLFLWAACFLMAAVPVMGLPYFGTLFYRNNAVCMPLFLHQPQAHGWQYSAFIFLGVNLLAFLFIVYAYAGMFLAIRRSRMTYRPADESQERCLMKRFFFIVITNLLCWMPIVLLKVAALAGVKISRDLYAWLMVFVLPVNCALTPSPSPPYLNLPYLTSPYLILTYLTLTLPYLPSSLSYLNSPYLTLPLPSFPYLTLPYLMSHAGVKISGDLYAWLVVFVLPVNCYITPSPLYLTSLYFYLTLPYLMSHAGVKISGDLYAWLVVFVLPVNCYITPSPLYLTSLYFYLPLPYLMSHAGVKISGDLYAWLVVFVLPVNCYITPSPLYLTSLYFYLTLPYLMPHAGVKISGDLYAWLVVFVLPVNCALNPLLYTLSTRLFKQRLLTGLASAVWNRRQGDREGRGRRKSLETNSSFSNFSFSSLKSRGSSSGVNNNNASTAASAAAAAMATSNNHLLNHLVGGGGGGGGGGHHNYSHNHHHHHHPLAWSVEKTDLSELEPMNGVKEKGSNLYVGKMKYMYSHGRVIYPPGKHMGAQHIGYKPVAS
ncbi:hypothetical protein ACOMHN_006881 [Nucella lapillus]